VLLQIPHTPARPALVGAEDAAAAAAGQSGSGEAASAGNSKDGSSAAATEVEAWSSADRLNVSVGLLYALCNAATAAGASAGFCVPRPQLLRRWLQAGVHMKQVSTPITLTYPSSAHDYAYYKGSTVAYFMVEEVKEALEKVLSIVGN
jgi:kinesin family protein 4/21/27